MSEDKKPVKRPTDDPGLLSDEEVILVLEQVGHKATHQAVLIYKESIPEQKAKMRAIGPYRAIILVLKTLHEQHSTTLEQLQAGGVDIVAEYQKIKNEQN